MSRDTRLDAVGGSPKQRDAALMGGIGREKTRPIPKMPQSQRTTKPTLRRGEEGKPVDMGGTNKRAMESMIRRRTTRRIPKEDGQGITGDNPALTSMSRRERAPGPNLPPVRDNLPPVVSMPVPRASMGSARNSPPTPPPARGNTLAGVSAEELLGEEGKRLLENLRRRESEAEVKPLWQQPPAKGSPLAPRMHDSSLLAFQAAEYEKEAPENDELQPQGNFLSGPRQAVSGDVVQTPMAADDVEAPPDDLGYEQSVDYGQDYEETGRVSEKRPSARVQAAHEEMEQRAGYLLWLQGVITREEIDEALETDDGASEVARDLLEGSTFADQPTLYSFLARHESLALADLDKIKPSERALALLSPSVARSHRVVPLERIGGILLVAAAWPFEPKRLLELRRLTGSKIKLFVVTEPEIDTALSRYYPHASAATLRSPVPRELLERKGNEPPVKGGTALIKKYDPTIDGSASGLYAPDSANTPPGGFSVGGDEVEFDSHAETGEYPAVDADDIEVVEESDSKPDELDPFA